MRRRELWISEGFALSEDGEEGVSCEQIQKAADLIDSPADFLECPIPRKRRPYKLGNKKPGKKQGKR